MLISPAREIAQDSSLAREKKATVVMQDTAMRFYSHPTNSSAQLKKFNSSLNKIEFSQRIFNKKWNLNKLGTPEC